MIDVLVPMLGRPDSIRPLLESFEQHSGLGDKLIFIISPSDTPIYKECVDIGVDYHMVAWEPGPADYARKMNEGFWITDQPWVFLAASDITFTPGWTKPAGMDADVIATNDQANAQVQRGMFGTHCFVRRSYVDEQGASADGPGVLLHEGYDHNFVDREMCGVAQSRRRFHFAKEAIVPHRHYLWGTAKKDRTYIKAMRHFHQDRQLFLSRAHLWGYAGLNNSEKRLAIRQYRDIVRQK